MASMTSGSDLKWTSPHNPCSFPAGGGGGGIQPPGGGGGVGMDCGGDHGFYPHMARDIQQSFLGASPMSHFAAAAAAATDPSPVEGKPTTMTIS